MINPAVNLQSLLISKADHLYLDSVDFSPFLPHLRYLNLTSVLVSADKLLCLFKIGADESATSQITCIQFGLVTLTAGTWHSVLVEMSRLLTRLVDFSYVSGGHLPTWPEVHLVPEHLYTLNINDDFELAALGHLQRVVNGNRVKAGLEMYTENEFEYLEEPPLELVEQVQLNLKKD